MNCGKKWVTLKNNLGILADVLLKRIRKYCSKKHKNITKEEKEKYKAFFEGEENVFIIKKLAI